MNFDFTDDPHDTSSQEFAALLCFTNLIQRVFFLTDTQNHTLDLGVTSHQTLLSPSYPSLISDHFRMFTQHFIKPISLPILPNILSVGRLWFLCRLWLDCYVCIRTIVINWCTIVPTIVKQYSTIRHESILLKPYLDIYRWWSLHLWHWLRRHQKENLLFRQ